jgi:DNA polymerase-1
LPEFNAGSSTTRNEAWRQGCNFPVQCTATEFTHVAAILAAPALRLGFDAHMILHVHDSVVFEVPAEQAREAAAALRYIMQSEVPRYFELRLDAPIPIPLRVDVSVGSSWGLTSPVTV